MKLQAHFLYMAGLIGLAIHFKTGLFMLLSVAAIHFVTYVEKRTQRR